MARPHFSVRRLNESELYKRYVYTKSSDWRYEREWRVWYPFIPAPNALHEDVPIRPSELAAVYIGCRADPHFSNEVISLTRKAFPHSKVCRACKSETEYDLEYTEI